MAMKLSTRIALGSGTVLLLVALLVGGGDLPGMGFARSH